MPHLLLIALVAVLAVAPVAPLSTAAQEAAVDHAGAGDQAAVQDPGTGLWVDPNTGFVLDPNSGQWVDPTSQQWTDPNAGYVDPNTGQWVDPNAGQWVDPNAAPADQPEIYYDPTSGESAPRDAPPIPEELGWTNPSTGEWIDLTSFQIGDAWPYGPDVPPPSSAPGSYSWAPPRTVYIPETGQSIDGVFLDSWRAWGGALSWGNPITPEFQEDGRIVQYYAFGRFEYWPEDPNGEVVKFGDLGAQTRPFMLRRGLAGDGEAATAVAAAARAWLPEDPSGVPPDDATWRFVPEAGHGVAGDFKAFWEATGEASYLGNPLTEQYTQNGRVLQVFERGVVAQEAGGAPYLLPIGEALVQRYRLDTTPTPQGDLPVYGEELFEAPAAIGGGGQAVDPNAEKWVRVSISEQYAWAMQGEAVLWQGPVSTGLPGFDTPTGTFYVFSKLPWQTMEGVLGGEYYRVPYVPSVMYITEEGVALHGTYWHNNFGQKMSHGCINLPMDVADWMYQWSPMGMRVEVVP